MTRTEKPDYSKTYWNHKGKHAALQTKLETLVPDAGEVIDCQNNPMLERFRVASNCYYDLYNNGLCNRYDEFKSVFEINVYRGENGYVELTQEIVDRTESAINRIILAAAKEQKIRRQSA